MFFRSVSLTEVSRDGVSFDPCVKFTWQFSLDRALWLLALRIVVGLLIQIVLNHLGLLEVGTGHVRLHLLLHRLVGRRFSDSEGGFQRSLFIGCLFVLLWFNCNYLVVWHICGN